MGTAAFILVIIMTGFALAGVFDRVFLKDHLGLGPAFEEGMRVIAPLSITMTGVLCMIPLLKALCSVTLVPVFRLCGLDPASAAGMLIALDMGGYPLACAIASDPSIGTWAGIVLGSMTGAAVIFTLPVGFLSLPEGKKDPFLQGVLYGLAACPAGAWIGGIMMGIRALSLTWNLVPSLLFSVGIVLSLHFRPQKTIRVFRAFAKGVNALSYLGLGLGIVKELILTRLGPMNGFPGLCSDLIAPAGEGIRVAGGIALLLAGAFPMAVCLRRWGAKPFARLGTLLGIGTNGVYGLVMSCVNNLGVFPAMREMNDREVVINSAFTVCAAFAVGDHLAFAASEAPEAALPMLTGKLFAGVLAVMISVRMLRGEAVPEQREIKEGKRKA